MGLSLWSATGKHELAWSTHLQGSLLCLQLLLQTDKLCFDGISTQPALYYEKAYFIVEPGWFLWGFIKWNPSWEIAQPLTHIDPQKQIPPSSHQTIFYLFHPIISINHPPTSSHPFILLPPPSPSPHSQVALTLWRTVELNWWLLDTVCCLWDVWYVANPLNRPSDPLPALSVKPAEVSGFR